MIINFIKYNFIYFGTWNSSVSLVATLLLAGWCKARIPALGRHLSLFRNVQTCSVAHPSSYSIGTGIDSRTLIGQGVKATLLHLVSRLRVSETIPLLPLYTFMVRSRRNLSVKFIYSWFVQLHRHSTAGGSRTQYKDDIVLFYKILKKKKE